MSEKIILQGKEAIELWRQGKNAWNKWVENNPVADVCFKGANLSNEFIKSVDFQNFHFPNGFIDFTDANFSDKFVDFSMSKFGEGNISFIRAKFDKHVTDFSGTQFGKGNIYFTEAHFGEGNVYFQGAHFGEGNVFFSQARFDKGDIIFSDAKFNDGSVDFSNTRFGEGNVDFTQAQFGEGNVYFTQAQFGKGNVYFTQTQFGQGTVEFSGAKFDEGIVDFSKSYFGNGNIDFSMATFSEGYVYFTQVQFGDGNVDFSATIFNTGVVCFSRAQFGEGSIDFSYSNFGRHANFSSFNTHNKTKSISFRYAVFTGSLEFSTQSEINIIPDLVGTKTTNHTSLSGMRCKPKIENKHLFIFSKATDRNDTEKLCRLKEIAESNKDHAAALRFHADEMRAKRWQKEKMGTTASLLDWLFDVFSLYGQSIYRPMTGLLLTITTSLLYTVGFCFPLLSPSSYAQWFTNMGNISHQTWVYGFDIVLSRSIPFLGGARVDGALAFKVLEKQLPAHFSIVSAGFSLFAFSFIFLIGLGLRNRFRL